MDWYTILYAARWVIISLLYCVLLLVVFTVYREASGHVGAKSNQAEICYGHLRVIHPGSDSHLAAGKLINLAAITRLGAARDNDVVLGDQFVSGYHLRLRWDGAAWWLEDLHSKNGTLVNRQPCAPDQPQILPHGAFLTVGDVVMELVL